MGIRLLCISTAKNTTKLLNSISNKMNDDIDFLLHLGDKDSDIKASSMTRMNLGKGKNGHHIMETDQYKGVLHSFLDQAEFEKNASQFIDHLHRRDQKFCFKPHNLSTPQDYMDYYHILYDHLSAKIIENKISHMLFFNVPHLAYDTICYQIGKALNIKVTIVTQSLFPNKFYSMRSAEDYGYITDTTNNISPIKIKKNEEVEWFYMKNIKQGEEEKGYISFKALVNILLYTFLNKPHYFLNFTKLFTLIKRATSIYKKLPEWRDPFAKYFHENEFEYFEHIIQYEKTKYDLDAPYVYFAMQMQPEMTTSALGGWFRDQALAIESLARLLPTNINIYVKENPKQGAYMRGPLFFHRLKRIPNVSILPSHANTHALTENALFVSTITGTVGWEALRKGKNVLIFGNTWYQSFPGVFKYHKTLKFEEVIEYQINHSALEYSLGLLVSKAHDGVVDRHYKKIVNSYNEELNTEKVSGIIIDLIKERSQPTFLRK